MGRLSRQNRKSLTDNIPRDELIAFDHSLHQGPEIFPLPGHPVGERRAIARLSRNHLILQKSIGTRNRQLRDDLISFDHPLHQSSEFFPLPGSMVGERRPQRGSPASPVTTTGITTEWIFGTTSFRSIIPIPEFGNLSPVRAYGRGETTAERLSRITRNDDRHHDRMDIRDDLTSFDRPLLQGPGILPLSEPTVGERRPQRGSPAII